MMNIIPLANTSHQLWDDVRLKSRNFSNNTIRQQNTFFVWSLLWRNVPKDCQSSISPDELENKVKTWVTENCPCKIYKTCALQVGCFLLLLYYNIYITF